MDVKKRGPVGTLAQGKTAPAGESMAEEQQAQKKKKSGSDGLVGLVNIGNSCYMNATIQALSNCPPFRQYFIDYHQQGQSYSSPRAADSLSALFRKMWTSERHPGHLSARQVSSGMKNKLFHGSQQQDAQEFLRCLLTQIHDEIKITVPDSLVCGCGRVSCDRKCCPPRDSMVSCTSHDSNTSAESLHQKVVANSSKNSPLLKKRAKHSSQKSSAFTTHSASHVSPAIQPKFSFNKGKSKHLAASAGSKTSVESIPQLVSHHGGSKLSLEPTSETVEEGPQWSKDDLLVVDLIMRTVTVHRQYFAQPAGATTREEGSLTSRTSALTVPSSRSRSSTPTLPQQKEQQQRHKQLGSKDSSSSVMSSDSVQASVLGDVRGRADSQTGERGKEIAMGESKKVSQERVVESTRGFEEVDHGSGSANTEERLEVGVISGRGSVPPSPVPSHHSTGSCGEVPLRERRKRVGPPRTTSIVNEVFEGVLESRVKCLACKKVSVTREPFQDLSLPIPGRKEIAKINSKAEHGGEERGGGEDQSGRSRSSLSRGLSTVWNFMTALTRDYVSGPLTNIHDCLDAFFGTSDLKGENRYYCSNCKSFQNSVKEMSIVHLPEVLCIHLKRFRFDTYLSNKISRHIAFPLTELDLSPYIKVNPQRTCSSRYDLSAVVTHYGGAGGGHYVAFAKNSSRNSWFEYNDTRIHPVSADTVLSAQGYVLFYKKVATSQSSQPLDISTFLPRAGTRLPSPDICYISRHWLYLLKHFSSPGPILQFEYACKHGAVVPEKAEGASSLAMCIRREVWEDLEKKHGGGPLVPQLEACSVCQELLENLKVRRKTEKERVHQLQTQERQVEKDRKTEPYLLSIDWLQQWQKFIHCTTLEVEPPGPVDNTHLLQVIGDKVTMVDGALFRKLSPAAWKYFLHIYGGGPTIVTTLDALQ